MARAPHAPRVLGDAPVIAAHALLDPPPVTEIVTKTYYYVGAVRHLCDDSCSFVSAQ